MSGGFESHLIASANVTRTTFACVLLDGVNHVAVLTQDTDRLSRFYAEVFDSPPAHTIEQQPGFKLSIIHIGEGRELNVFEIDGNAEANRQAPMFGRGRLDHVGLQAASLEAFGEIRRRLITSGAADDFVTDFGPVLSVFFVDPDGLEGEVLVANPDSEPGVFNPPGTHRVAIPRREVGPARPPHVSPCCHTR